MSQNTTLAHPNRGVEVTLVTTYPRPRSWGNYATAAGDAAEISIANSTALDKHWTPTTEYFRIVANTPNFSHKQLTEVFDVANLGDMLGAIINDLNGKERAPKSLRRLNIVGHGSGQLFGLSGEVMDNGDVYFKSETVTGHPEKVLELQTFNMDVVAWLNGDGRSARDQARRIFSDDAEIVLLLCNSAAGAGVALMIDISRAFNVAVRGWADEIGYGFSHSKGRIDENSIVTGRVDAHKNLIQPTGKGYPCYVQVPPALAGRHLLPFAASSPAKPKTPTP